MKEITKDILFGSEARDKLVAGANTIANAVKATLGPRGRNVVLEKRLGKSHLTKDGVSVAKEIYLSDPFENLGAQMLRDVAKKTADLAGDGTTTSIVLAQAILNEGMKHVQAGANPMELKRGIDSAVEVVVEGLKGMSTAITTPEQLLNIATISANGDKEMGALCADAISMIGKDGVVTVEEGTGLKTTVDVTKGLQFDSGLMSDAFIDNFEKGTANFKDAAFILTDIKLGFLDPILPLLNEIQEAGKDLVIICDEIDIVVLKTLIMNKMENHFNVAVVNAPAFGQLRVDMFKDIAAVTGATFFTKDTSKTLDKATVEDLGFAKTVTMSKDRCTIVDGLGAKEGIDERLQGIETSLVDITDVQTRTNLLERKGRLTGGVAVIEVGGSSDIEVKEKKDRIDDAICATKAALEEGFLPGGGTALYDCVTIITNQMQGLKNGGYSDGFSIVSSAMCAPLETLCANAGIAPVDIFSQLAECKNLGYNFATNVLEDLVEAGVIDPTKVVRCALQDAASVAGLMLTTDVAVTINRESLNREF